MGVTGLWQLLEPAGKPVTLESLEGKILAIDVSLWLHQAIRGSSDYQHGVKNPHLVTLFNRVTKLLFYRVKPVFVFDGPNIPVFKQRTLAQRKLRRDIAGEKVTKIRRKMLLNHAKQAAFGSGAMAAGDSLSPTKRRSIMHKEEEDIFEIPYKMPRLSSSGSDDGGAAWEDVASEVQNSSFSDIDVKSEQFRALPLEIQHDLLLDMQETKHTRVPVSDLPSNVNDFSSFQLKRLLNKNQVTQSLDDVKQQMATSRGMLLLEDYGVSMSDPKLKDTIRDYLKRSKIQILPESKNSCDILINSDELNGLPGFGMFSTPTTNGDGVGFPLETPGSSANSFEHTLRKSEHLLKTQISSSSSGSGCKKSVSSEKQSRNSDNDETPTSERTLIEVDPVQSWCEKGDLFVYPVPVPEDTPAVSDITKTSRTDDKRDCSSRSMVDLKQDNDDFERLISENSDERFGSDEHSGREQSILTDNHCSNVSHSEGFNSAILPDCYDLLPNDVADDVTVDKSTKTVPVDSFSKSSAISSTISPVVDYVAIDRTGENEVTSTSVSASKFDQNSSRISLESCQNITVPEDSSGSDTSDGEKEDDFIDVEEPATVDVEEATVVNLPIYVDPVPRNCTNSADSSKLGERLAEAGNEVPSTSAGPHKQGFVMDQEMQQELHTEMLGLTNSLNAERSVAETISEKVYKDCQALLGLLGVPYVISAGEAEAQCAWLELAKLVHGTVTDDSDIWLFGGRRVYKNLFNRNRHVHYYTIEDVTRKLGLSRLQLIQLAFLTGCDYFEGLDGIGIVHGIEVISEFYRKGDENLEALERFRDWMVKDASEIAEGRNCSPNKVRLKKMNLKLPPGFPNENILKAYLNPDVDESRERFSWSRPDLQLLRHFCAEYLNWTEKRVNDVMLPIMQRISETERNQLRITSFTSSVDFKISEEAMPAKRLGKALKKLKSGPDISNGDQRLKEVVDIESEKKRSAAKIIAAKKMANKNKTSKTKGHNSALTKSKHEKPPTISTSSDSNSIVKGSLRKSLEREISNDSISDDELLEILALAEANESGCSPNLEKIANPSAVTDLTSETHQTNDNASIELDFTESENDRLIPEIDDILLNELSACSTVCRHISGEDATVLPKLPKMIPNKLAKTVKRTKLGTKCRKPLPRSKKLAYSLGKLSESESD